LGRRVPQPPGLHQPGEDARRGNREYQGSYRGLCCSLERGWPASACPALKGHNVVAGGNAPGTATRKPVDPGGVAQAPTEAPCRAAARFSLDPFRVVGFVGARSRGRCPRLLYRTPSGTLSVSITLAVQRKMWDILSTNVKFCFSYPAEATVLVAPP